MKQKIIFTTIITLALSSQFVIAGSITDTYTTGDTLTATKMDNIKTAVNDNNSNISSNTSDIAINAQRIDTLSSSPKIWSGFCTSHGRTIGWNKYCADGVDFDTANAQIHVNADGTFTVLEAGFYSINAWAISNVLSSAHVRLVVNGVTKHYGHTYSGNQWIDNNMDIIWPMNAGDTFYIDFYSGGGNNYAYHSGNGGGAHSRVQVSLIGPR